MKSERLARLQTLLNEQQHAFNESFVGRSMDILLEKPGRDPKQLIGRSPWLQSVIVDASVGKIGDIVNVKITEAGPNSLKVVNAKDHDSSDLPIVRRTY